MPKWKTISLPEEMIKEIDKYIKDHPEYGYTSVSAFVRMAINAFREYQNILKQKEHGE